MKTPPEINQATQAKDKYPIRHFIGRTLFPSRWFLPGRAAMAHMEARLKDEFPYCDQIVLSGETCFSFWDRIRILISGRTELSCRINTQFEVGSTKVFTEIYPLPPRFLK